MSKSSLPIVDLSQFREVSTRSSFVAELRDVLYDHGFFYLTGHAVAPELTARVIEVSQQFFALPEEDKLAIEMVKSRHFRGYNRVGFELTGGKKDWREQVDFDTDKPALDLKAGDAPWKRAIGPNQWPEALPELRDVILKYQAEATRVGREVLKAIAVAINHPEDTFESMFEPHPAQHLKIVRYPGSDLIENQQGVGAHKDGGLITILLNDHNPGLMVQTSTGEWIEAPPIPGLFIVNTGELLEMITDGFVRADVHRVITPPAGVSRYSVPFFLGANLLAPLPQLRVAGDLRRAVRGITKDPTNPLFQDVGTNHLKARIRSHPDVARAHYKDVELRANGFAYV
ncbi:isopenicillin N synthase family oxygenase [Burkholderia contaminans]|uniref:Isopenicillin N synthase family oxygenase n=1 Tax=Burkholderia contaminans TaxID=488447 RepID=A0A3N8PTT9_9BURK|nr:2-oxoglutarate and iron-dependent oxygenase domain-containing protein [Burkholderia contaminans]RQT15004.1 isopenicillin N synthase family oxygenase [Burkholderia contaminans]